MQIQNKISTPIVKLATPPQGQQPPAEVPQDSKGDSAPVKDNTRAKILAAVGATTGTAAGVGLGVLLSAAPIISGVVSAVAIGAVGAVMGGVAGLEWASKHSNGGHTAGFGMGLLGVGLGVIGGGVAGAALGGALGTLAPPLMTGVVGAGVGLIAASRYANSHPQG